MAPLPLIWLLGALSVGVAVVGTTTYRYLRDAPPDVVASGEAVGRAGAVADIASVGASRTSQPIGDAPLSAKGDGRLAPLSAQPTGSTKAAGAADVASGIPAGPRSFAGLSTVAAEAGLNGRVTVPVTMPPRPGAAAGPARDVAAPFEAPTATVSLGKPPVVSADASWGFGGEGDLVGRADQPLASVTVPGPLRAARVAAATAPRSVTDIRTGGTTLQAVPLAEGRVVPAPIPAPEPAPVATRDAAGDTVLSEKASDAEGVGGPVAASPVRVAAARRAAETPVERVGPSVGASASASPVPASSAPIARIAPPALPRVAPRAKTGAAKAGDQPVRIVSARRPAAEAPVAPGFLEVTDWRAGGAKVISVVASTAETAVDAGAFASGVGVLRPGPKVMTVSRVIDVASPIEVTGRGEVTIEAVRTGASRIVVRGRGAAGTTVRANLNGTDIGEVSVGDDARFAFDLPARMLPGAYELRIEPRGVSVDAGGSATIGFTLDQGLRQTRTRRVTPLNARVRAEAVAVEAQPHVVVIVRGDNLWRIARRVYGDGISFPTIVNANRDLIRNPDLIFPGQVFVLPLLETHRLGDTARG